MISNVHESLQASKTSLLAALKESTKSGNIDQGRTLHILAIQSGLVSDRFVSCSLINMYSKFTLTFQATELFNSLHAPDTPTWNALLWGYIQNGENSLALHFLPQIPNPNALTFVALLKASSHLSLPGNLPCLSRAMFLHAQTVERSLHTNLSVATSIVKLYSSCGSMVDARFLFESLPSRDVILWTALIQGYVENGEMKNALQTFTQIDVDPNSRTLTALVKASTILSDQEHPGKGLLKPVALERAFAIHSRASQLNLLDKHLQSGLLGLYATSGSISDARRLFDTIRDPDSISWTALILGYTNSAQPEKARSFFFQMLEDGGCFPDVWTLVSALKTCSALSDLALGSALHVELRQLGLHRHAAVVSSLVDLYSRCGRISEAEEAFRWRGDDVDVVTWSSLVAGYSRVGDACRAVEVYRQMQRGVNNARVTPDAVTCVSVLAACSRGGLVEEGREVFLGMRDELGVEPGVEHYHCVIDMLGRGNRVEEAVEVAEKMPFEPSEVTWTSILGSCIQWGRTDLGRLAFEKLLKS